jgi:hypothetical protein
MDATGVPEIYAETISQCSNRAVPVKWLVSAIHKEIYVSSAVFGKNLNKFPSFG